MEFSGELFPTSWLWSFAALYAWLLSRALRWADWKRLADNVQLNVFLGAVVCVSLMWTLRTEVQPGFAWHLSGMVALTLMFGWFGWTIAPLDDEEQSQAPETDENSPGAAS